MPELLQQWAVKHGVSRLALHELIATLSGFDVAPPVEDPDKLKSEARVQSEVRLEAARCGYWLTRNNVGAFQDPRSVVCVHCHKPALGSFASM